MRGLNRLTGKYFSDKALYKLAERLGSDVPYCLYGKTALCEGRGEVLTKLPDTLSLNVVVAISGERVSTPSAYSKLDVLYSDFDGTKKTDGDKYYDKLLCAMSDGNITGDALYNIFEAAVLSDCKGAAYIKDRLLTLGADAAMMSGSGPSVFGIFKTAEAADSAARSLKKENISAFVAFSV